MYYSQKQGSKKLTFALNEMYGYCLAGENGNM